MDNEQEIIKLGIVGIKNMGVYDADTTYTKLNVVTYNGSSYCALQNTKGNLPTNSDYWQLYAQKGDQGDQGIQGIQGPKPVRGVDYWTETDIENIEATLSSDVHDEVNTQIGSLTSATPLVATSTAEMTNTTRIYVNTTDGYWYYYNGSAWTQGGVYQSTGFSDIILIDNISLNITGFISAQTGNLNADSGFKSSDFIEVKTNETIVGNLHQVRDSLACVAFYDENQHFISAYWGEDATLIQLISINQSIPANCKYIRVSTKEDNNAYANKSLNILTYIDNINSNVEQITKISMNLTGYVGAATGNFSATSGFKASDFIEVKYGQKVVGKLYQVRNNLACVAFYDEKKNYMYSYAGDGEQVVKLIDIDIKIPLGAKYIRVSTKEDNDAYANIIENTNNWIDSVNNLVDNNFIVDKSINASFGKTYKSLIECLKYIETQNYTSPVNVYVRAGVYDIYEELGGVDFLSSITSSDTTTSIDQPWLYNVNLIGLGNVILNYNPPVADAIAYPYGEPLISVLNVRGNVNIENINIDCSYCRYAIHDETAGIAKYNNTYHNYKNVYCKMNNKTSNSSGGQTIGIGFDNGQSYLFENCKIYNENAQTPAKSDLYMHNRSSYGANITIKDCIFDTIGDYNISFSNVLIQERSNVNISNSNLNKKLYIRGENASSTYNCFQLYVNNCNDFDIEIASNITTNPYIPIIKNTI